MCKWNREHDKNLEPGIKNFIRQKLIDPIKALLPQLHIKLRIMKQLIKALDKKSDSFQHMFHKCPRLSDAKIKGGMFDGP